MPYSTNEELINNISEELLIQLTDDEGTGAVVWTRVEEKRADADALIDSYCGERYTVPFAAPVPRIISKLSGELTVYELYKRRLGPPENLQTDYKNNIKLLSDIQSGDAKLTVSVGETAPVQSADSGITVSTTRQEFSHRRFRRF